MHKARNSEARMLTKILTDMMAACAAVNVWHSTNVAVEREWV